MKLQARTVPAVTMHTRIQQVFENEIISHHKIMCPPNVSGEVVKLYGGGTDGKDLFHVDEPVMEVRFILFAFLIIGCT
jgi:vacuolar-type H+-ATPase catalytic subunit A/Vma1